MQKAIVAHPIACEGIEVEEGKNVLFATTPDQYVEHIKRLMSDDDERAMLGVNARQLIEHQYAYQIIGENMSAMYEACATLPTGQPTDPF